MSLFGSTIPWRGRELIARLLATSTPLTLTRIMMGQGTCPVDVHPADLSDLVEPVAAGTSTTPLYNKDTINMTLQYRSDLNGGLDHGFWIREFGVFAKDLDGKEVLLFYGTLGDYPQWVSAAGSGGIDVREYDIAIHIGEGATVVIDYTPAAFLTSENVVDVCTTIILPQFMVEVGKAIDTHNTDPDAHPSLRGEQAAIDARLSLLELMYNTDVSGNPFTVTFDTLTGLEVQGVWNAVQKRIEF